VFVSPSGLRFIWLRNGLASCRERFKALEVKVAEEGIILTESQVQALERTKLDEEVCGEIDTAHPGYLGSQDTSYVGIFKGVGRVYQQTCSRPCVATLCGAGTAAAAIPDGSWHKVLRCAGQA